MCGIAGILGPHDPMLVRAACDAQAHRGPDDEGFLEDSQAQLTLGHKRLSILDPKLGRQPMLSADGNLRIVFNGEIFNAPGLRAELEESGRVFATRNSDTEVLLHLYSAYGEEMLARLMGMYAFCIHDKRARKLFLARDRAGIKPLYFTRAGGRFAFSSELKALLGLPWVSRSLDPESLFHYLGLQFVPAPRTIVADVEKLPAGHFLTLDARDMSVRIERHWSLKFEPDPAPTGSEWALRCRETLGRAVSRWSLSDVPLACSLSGGLDSSAIVAFMALGSNRPPRTYSLGFSGKEAADLDELDLARKVARKWSTDHHEMILDPETLLDDLDAMVWHLDEPYGGGLPSWYVFRHIGRDVKVAMTGTGGDELFGNYGKWLRFEAPGREGLRIAMEQAGETDPEAFRQARNAAPHGALYHKYLTGSAKARLLKPWARPGNPWLSEILIERIWAMPGGDAARDAVARVDFALQLPEEFLLVTDRFSMAHGVEARTPFLDEEMVDLVRSIPAPLRTRPDALKCLFKAAVGDLLPEELLTAPKRGFILPLTDWTRAKLRPRIEAALSPAKLKRHGIFERTVWDEIVLAHLEKKKDLTQQVWTLFMFELWRERFLGD